MPRVDSFSAMPYKKSCSIAQILTYSLRMTEMVYGLAIIPQMGFFLAILACLSDINAQTITYTGFRFNPGSFYESQEPQDALDLVSVYGGPTGKIWFQQSKDGIIVHGKIKGAYPKWPQIPREIGTHSHVDLWISGAENVEMPEIGWGNQFGSMNCEKYAVDHVSAEQRDNCSAWSSRQALYRNQLHRLFVRHWQFAPDICKETFATQAYSGVLEYAKDHEAPAFRNLQPTAHPYLMSMNSTGFWKFEIFVRWSDLPPLNSLAISRLYAAVQVFDSSQKYSTTTPKRKGGDASTFTQLRLERPITYKITACDYPVIASDIFKNKFSGWFLPNEGTTISDLFVLVNDATGYRYDPEGLSPIPLWTHYFSKDLDRDHTVCGPLLRYRAAETIIDSDYVIDEKQFASKKLPDGSYLIKSGPIAGPYSSFGSGQCGACETMRMSVYRLGTDGGVSRAFESTINLEQPLLDGFDIQLSPNWNTITIYRKVASAQQTGEKPIWTFERYCFKSDEYEKCGSGPSDPPPLPYQFNMR